MLNRISSVGMGNLLGQGIALLSLPLLARIYSPEEFALWILFQSAVLIFSTIATLRFELAILLPEKIAAALSVLFLSFLFSAVSAGVSWIAILSVGDLIFGDSFARISGIAYLSVILVGSAGFYYTALSWLTRTKQFKWYSFGCFALPFFTAVFQLGFGYLGWSEFSGLVVGSAIGQTIAALLLTAVVVRDVFGQKSELGKLDMPGAFTRYRTYFVHMTPFTLLGTLRNRIIYMLLNDYSTVHAGYYGMAFRLTNAPNGFFTGAVRPVFFQWATERDFRTVERNIVAILKIMMSLVVPAWLVLLVYMDRVVAVVFGQDWGDVGAYVIVLSFPSVALLLTNWLDRGFDVLGEQKTAFGLELIFSCGVILSLFIGTQLFDEIMSIVVLQAAVMFLYFWVWLHTLFARAGYSRYAVARVFVFFCTLVALALPAFYFLAGALPGVAGFLSIALLAGSTMVLGAGRYIRELRNTVSGNATG